jgi:hypothetical protein
VTAGLLRAALLFLLIGGVGMTAAALTSPVVRVNLPAAAPARGGVGTMATEKPSGALIQRALERPAFRADRRPSSVAYDATQPVTPDAPSRATVPKPTLAVSGIVWGPEPAAVLEGVPGVEGSTVVRRGESAAGLRVIRIEGELVVVRGLDTTWTLKVRNPWP